MTYPTHVRGTIKLLVWDDLPSAGIDLPLSYCIGEDEYGHWNVSETYRECSDLLDGGPFPTLEAAKSAAQADYEARILAQIDLATGDCRMIAAENLAEQLRNLLAVYAEPDRKICCDQLHCGCEGTTTWPHAEFYARVALSAWETAQCPDKD